MALADRINKTTKKVAIFIVKVSVSTALLYLLISRIGTQTIISNIRASSPIAFMAAVGAYILATYISSMRWRLLIPHVIRPRRLFSLCMIGSFFNAYMPGIIGGDAVKAYYLSKVLKEDTFTHPAQSPLSTAVASVFLDRYMGFSALLAISIIAFPVGFKYLEGTAVKWLIPVVLVAFVVGSITIFKFRLGERLGFLFGLYEYLHIYNRKRHILFKAFLYSLFIQTLSITSVYILSRGISLHIPFLSLLVFVPIIILISFIPVSISGIGLREGAFVVLLGTVGVPPDLSVTLSILWFLSVVVASLWGLFEYLRFKTVLGGEVK